MDYMPTRDAGEVWGISQRRVNFLCSTGRVPGAIVFNKMWLIPVDAPKPGDPRKVNEDDELKPVVKWAGGKRQLLPVLEKKMPKGFGTYFEPFVGGGALFLDLAYNTAVINDINPELIAIYRCLKDENSYRNLLAMLDDYTAKHNASKSVEEAKEFYYQIRDYDKKEDYQTLPDYEKAARAIYLNKTCFNGLYRVNSKGFFNVPFADKLSVTLYSSKNLDSIHNYLSKNNITIFNGDYHEAVKTAEKGDFVYFDPPYDTLKKETKSFTAYAKDDFGEDEQIKLSGLCKELSERGVYCMLSNHNTDLIRSLYSDFNISVVHAKRMINSKATGRGPVEEVVITNYPARD